MIHILNVSMPRSGHHLFEILLDNILTEDFTYCEFYGPKDCCRAIPCVSLARTVGRRDGVFMQKSHDGNFDDPIVVVGTYRVVQYRAPVARALSHHELRLKNGEPDDLRTFRNGLVADAWYHHRFYKKWLQNRSPDFFFISYEDLTSDLFKVILAFFDRVGFMINHERICEGIARTVNRRGRDDLPFVNREVISHRYAREAVLADYEDIVLRDSKGYYPTRYFQSSNSEGSLIGRISAR